MFTSSTGPNHFREKGDQSKYLAFLFYYILVISVKLK